MSEKKDIPGLHEFIVANEAIDELIQNLGQRKNELFADGGGEEYREAHAAWRKALDERSGKRLATLETLRKATDDELVLYLVDRYFEDYPHPTLHLLKVMPASFTELSEVAREQGWCDVWYDGVEDAIEEGVLTVNEVELTHHRLRRRLRDEVGKYEAEELMQLVDKLVSVSVKADRAARIDVALSVPDGVPE